VSAGTLANPVKLYGFLDAATKSLTADRQLASLTRLADLAKEVSDIGLDRVQFLTMPITTYEPDPNRLAPAADAEAFWDRIRLDRPLSKAQRAGATSAEVSAASTGDSATRTKGEGSSATPTRQDGERSSSSAADVERTADAEANGLCA
jgi:hypothetical protein